MRVAYAYVIVSLSVLGCSQQAAVEDDKGLVSAARERVEALTELPGGKIVASGAEILGLLSSITNVTIRLQLIKEWEQALYSRSASSLAPTGKGAESRYVREAVGRGVLNALRDSGCTDRDVWDVKFRLLNWMRSRVAELRPKTYDPVSKENRESWGDYETAVLTYENTVEQFELDMNDSGRWHGESQEMEIRREFSKLIGRRVRGKNEIKRLGLYSRLAREKIDNEKKSGELSCTSSSLCVCDRQGVSNIVLRMQEYTGETNYCQRILNGAAKEDAIRYLDSMR